MLGKLIGRHEKVAYYGVPDTEGNVVYHRMCGFTKMDTSKNPVEYSRIYIDESFEQTDVVAISPSISFTFDRYGDNPVHDDIVMISDNEILGADAVRAIVVVDMSQKDEGGKCPAILRDFSVMVETEGKIVKSISDVSENSVIKTSLSDGYFESVVTKIEEKK